MSFSNMIKGFVNGEEIAYVKNGLVLKGVTMQVMVGSEDDLVNLPEDIMPGSVAFTAGYGSMWQKAADGSWEEISQEGGGGGGGGGAMLLTVTATHGVDTTVYTLNKTWKEIRDALAAGTQVILTGADWSSEDNMYQFFVYSTYIDSDTYYIGNQNLGGSTYESTVINAAEEFATDNAEGYPSTFAYDN